jgi:hypothetical protein
MIDLAPWIVWCPFSYGLSALRLCVFASNQFYYYWIRMTDSEQGLSQANRVTEQRHEKEKCRLKKADGKDFVC